MFDYRTQSNDWCSIAERSVHAQHDHNGDTYGMAEIDININEIEIAFNRK